MALEVNKLADGAIKNYNQTQAMVRKAQLKLSDMMLQVETVKA